MEIVLALVAIAIIAMLVKPYKVAKEYYTEKIPKLYALVRDKIRKSDLTFKEALFYSFHGLVLLITVIVGFPFMLFVLYSIFIAPILAMFAMM
jgi:hypothetical protein